jgi:hypothetical protein
MKDSIKPVLKAGKTNKAIANQGYTYNQAGMTYNEIGVMYGGIYNHDIYPTVSLAKQVTMSATIKDIKPILIGNRTNANIADQGYTYNEAGLTYNQIGVMYGGIYDHDIYPLISMARLQKPMNIIGINFDSTVIPPTPPPGGNSGYLIGMLGMTYP